MICSFSESIIPCNHLEAAGSSSCSLLAGILLAMLSMKELEARITLRLSLLLRSVEIIISTMDFRISY
jgi:hypothetical protein